MLIWVATILDELKRLFGAQLKGEHVKIFAKCDNCPEMKEVFQGSPRPIDWAAVDIESSAGRVSLVLCPGCGEVKLGPLLPKPKEVPSAG